MRGRRIITTDEKRITRDNVISVLQKAYGEHLVNAAECEFLLAYEEGNQPLKRDKKVRPEINIVTCDNLANEITEFKLGYNWGNPITYIQRGDKDIANNDPKTDDAGILMMNQMLDGEFASAKDQELFRFMEICGVGYQMVDVKREKVANSAFDLITLDPRGSFIVKDNTVKHRPMMSVTTRVTEEGETFFTCFTDLERFEIRNFSEIVDGKTEDRWEAIERSGEANPLGVVPVVEFIRSSDRMGCFERQIPEMDALNIMVSDLSNDISQETQSIWWGNDFEFPVDPVTKQQVPPKQGQWVLTYTTAEGRHPSIQPLTISPNYAGILSNIHEKRDSIKEKCSVPKEQEANGGSTGIAMSMSSGWHKAEVAAGRQANLVAMAKMQIADLIIRAIRISPNIPSGSAVLNVDAMDVKVSIIRNKTYDMATKANTYAVWVEHGIHPRHAIQQVEAFPDANLVYEDSRGYLDDYYESRNPKENTDTQDSSDQASNSPIIDGINMEKVDK